jgi:hypothetical protein
MCRGRRCLHCPDSPQAREPFAVFHSHNARLSLGTGTDVTFSDVGPDKIVFNMSEHTGNIWMAEWKER